ncbi:hypothetical protein HDV03_000546 [Kappamyces sp. JEL0829]|nr:hypothetical protein HDV03_000546 [Kappamyces sp. JEL0829]
MLQSVPNAVDWQAIATSGNVVIFASNAIIWAGHLLALLAIAADIRGDVDYLSLTDAYSVSARVFRACFASGLFFTLVLGIYSIYTVWLGAMDPHDLAVPTSLAVVQPVLAALATMLAKLACNETRFIKRLLLNDTTEKELSATMYSRWTFSYADDLIAIGVSQPLEDSHLDALIPDDTCIEILKQFRQSERDDRSLGWRLFLLIWKPFLWQQLSTLIGTITVLAGPFLLRLTLNYLADPSSVPHPLVPYAYGIFLFVATMTRSMADGQTFFLGRRMGLRIRATLISLIYQKSLKRLSVITSMTEGETNNPGKLTTLMSVDASKILEVCCYLMYIWSCPLQVLICILFLVYIAGPPALAGAVVTVLAAPLAGYLGGVLQRTRKRLMTATDARIGAINELLQGIRIVKFFAWEKRFAEKIKGLRETELGLLWKYTFASATYRVLWTATPVLVSFSTFATMTWLSGSELDISTAFTCLSIFQTLQRPLLIIPDMAVNCLEAWVSFKRIRDFLAIPELEDYINCTDAGAYTQDLVSFIPNSSFSWYSNVDQKDQPSPSDETQQSSSKAVKEFTLSNLSLSFPREGLSIIYGPTGSGKSALLSSILGEMNRIEGGVQLMNSRATKLAIPVAYASQQVWLQNATIKDNIVFGSSFNQQRYSKVLKYCALIRDLQVLEGGDMTEVGEKGVNLSGGQKARISLARALYSSSPIILMDDPLSAVDAPTAKFLFENAICGPLMKGRTRILVTHAVALCLPKADLVIEMKRGRPQVVDTPRLLSLSNVDAVLDTGAVRQKQESASNDLGAGSGTKLIEAETRMTGNVKLHVYWQYCQAAGGLVFVFLLVLTFSSTQLLLLGNDFWIKLWVDAYTHLDKTLLLVFQLQPDGPPGTSEGPSRSVDLFFYIGVYALIGLSSIVVLLIRILVVASASLKASRTLHASLTHKILRAPVRFFEKTPMGRLVNRFSKDIKDIDMEVAQFSSDFLANAVRVVALLAVILVVTPASLIGLFPVTFIYMFVGKRYLFAARELKRMESNTRSPIFSHFSETLQGTAVIRSYSAESRFLDSLYEKIDINNKSFSLIWILNRWLGIRIDLVGALLGLTTTLSVVFVSQSLAGIDAGYAGLSITYALGLSETLLWLVRMHAVMEMEMNAVERVDEYLKLEEEAPAIIDTCRPPDSWPAAGEIKVRRLTLRYAPDGPPILSEISFQTSAGEKIGIVGRTGAGKTTLSLAFFRFIEPEAGEILIDGINIANIGMYDLRSKLTVIPQDPVLFSGTLRSNLDPFSEYSDEEIWESLRNCHFLESCLVHQPSESDLTATEPANSALAHSISLETIVNEGGTNFSQGQRQLLCLARAILKQSKVIILDEASASLDHETDVKIQLTIRDRFQKSTLLCIAHRLSTIVDYDKILVLDKGKVSHRAYSRTCATNQASLMLY